LVRRRVVDMSRALLDAIRTKSRHDSTLIDVYSTLNRHLIDTNRSSNM